MTLLDDPPAVTDSVPETQNVVRTQPSAWRLALRLARRETQRRPGRTVLASLLIAVPVVAMTIGSVFARSESGSWAAQFERRYGDADIAVDRAYFAFTSADTPTVDLPVGTTVTEYLWLDTSVATGDPIQPTAWASITDLDVSDPAMGNRVEVIDGEPPDAGEILLPADLAKALDVTVGDDVTLDRPSGTWRLSGLSRVRDSYFNPVIVIPGFDRSRIDPMYDSTVTLYDLPDDISNSGVRKLAAELGGTTSLADPYPLGNNVTRGMAWGWVAGALALVAVGIIVAAAFATSARRQLVTIGQLSANGATESVIRRTLALQGTWTGLTGGLAGVALGFASLPVVTPLVEKHILQHAVGGFRISVVDLIVIALTATVAGTLAAAIPARSASRIPVMSALAGRRPLGRLPRWLVPTGLGLLAGGLGLVAIASLGINGASTGGGADVWALLIVLGVVSVVFGMCCATPLVIERVGSIGRRTSLSWRLALRSLTRSRTRSSAVVAAIAVAVGGSVAAGAIVETSMRETLSWTPLLPADMIVFDAYFDPVGAIEPDSTPIVDLDPMPAAPLPGELREQVLAIVPGATFTPMRAATHDPAPFNTQTSDGVWPQPDGPRIADPALIASLGLSSGDVERLETTGSLQPLARWQLAHPDDWGTVAFQFDGPNGIVEFTPTPAKDPYGYDYAGWGRPLVTETLARELGLDIVERGVIVQAPQPLTVDQRNLLSGLQSAFYGPQVDAFIEPGDPSRVTGAELVVGEQWNLVFDEPRLRQYDEGDLWIARLVVLGAAVLFGLLVVAIGLSLAAAEGRDERNVLAVVGATPASMRRQASARASVMALSGIALGIPTGFLPTWVLYSVLNADSAISTESLRFPWLIVGSLLIIVPLLVAVVAWSGSGIAQRFRPVSPTQRD